MEKQKEPLYCFRINEETGEITSYKITAYEKITYINRHGFRFDGKDIGYNKIRLVICRQESIGRFVSGKVYLWEDDLEKARSIALQEIKDRLDKVEAEAKRYKDFYGKLNQGE